LLVRLEYARWNENMFVILTAADRKYFKVLPKIWVYQPG